VAYLRHYQMQGDPGFFGSIFKGVKKLAGLALPVSLPGLGPVGKKVLQTVTKHKKGALIAGGIAAGAAAAAGGYGAAGGFAGRRSYRRMNVGNTKALKRSMRRVQGFAKLAKSTMTFTQHHKLKKPRRR